MSLLVSTEACPNPISTTFGSACVCNLEDGCGNFPFDPFPPNGQQALIVTSGQNEGLFKHEFIPVGEPLEMMSDDEENSTTFASMEITIDPEIQYQEILGFGSAITDASAYQLTEILNRDLMVEVLSQAFHHGNFTFSRVPMNAADFSRMHYAMAHELDLSDFCLRDDRTPDGMEVECGRDYKLDVLEYIIKEIQPDLKLYVSSWSAPPSFKMQNFECEQYSGVIECSPDPSLPPKVECIRTVTDPISCNGQPLTVPCNTTPSHDYEEGFPVVPGLDQRYNPDNIPAKNADGNCYHTGFVREDAYESWAQMYARFIQAYGERGVSFWGITSQNEPFTQTGLWSSNFWTVEGLRTFVRDFLTPAVRAVQPDIKIVMYDDQLINLTNAAVDMGDVGDGIGFHWYTTLESVFENSAAAPPIPGLGLNLVGGGADVKTVYDHFNGTKFMLMTESCSGYLLGSEFLGPRHGSFAFAYNTAHDMLWDFRNRASGYVYWNLILDAIGGPNLAGNYVDSPFYVQDSSSFVMNPSFFYIAHFSRFIPPGSRVIKAQVECGARLEEYCQFVAFKTPRNDIVVIMTNDEVTTDITFPLPLPPLAKGQGTPLKWKISCGDTEINGELPWKSIQTVVTPCVTGMGTAEPTTAPVSPPATTPSPITTPGDDDDDDDGGDKMKKAKSMKKAVDKAHKSNKGRRYTASKLAGRYRRLRGL